MARRAAPLHRLQVEMARKGSARGSSGARCFLVGALRNDASMDAPPCTEAFFPALVGAHAGLCELQLRFLIPFCLAGACPAALAAALGDGWRALARHSSILAPDLTPFSFPLRQGMQHLALLPVAWAPLAAAGY